VVPISVGGPINWQFVPDPVDYPLQVAPQIFVNSPTGPVKISNLTIDASGETTAPDCFQFIHWFTTAIMYQDSSGTVNRVNTVGQGKNSGCGVGIRATAATTSSNSVTISNNSIQDTNDIGIYVEAPTVGSSLKVNVSGNTLVLGDLSSSALSGIELVHVTGTISSNSIEAPLEGITQLGDLDVGPITISNNTIHANTPMASFGMDVNGSGTYLMTVSGNRVVDFYGGISLSQIPSAVNIAVKSNVVVNSSHAGIDLRCSSTFTLSGNSINNAATGVENVPTGFSLAGVSFYNVNQVSQGGCP
jgi:hypothetical protein